MILRSIHSTWQQLLPRHLMTRVIGYFANCRCKWFKNCFIRHYQRHYKIDLSCAEIQRAEDFACFNDFFTRRLQTDARPIDTQENSWISPVDGLISDYQVIEQQTLICAKGHDYTVSELLTDQHMGQLFEQGHSLTFYLSPRDYHRIHMPIDAQLKKMIYVPGQLFSVNPKTLLKIPKLLARNERLICHFTSAQGDLAMVWVGACIVGGLHTHWQGSIDRCKQIKHWHYQQALDFQKGDELGYFKLGSTVILLSNHESLAIEQQILNKQINMGQVIAYDR